MNSKNFLNDLVLLVLCLTWLMLCAGCGYHPSPINVYGASGKTYTAPDLCAALVICQNNMETACYYEHEVITYADGSRTDNGCKEVKTQN